MPFVANIASENILLHFIHSSLSGQQTTNATYTTGTWPDTISYFSWKIIENQNLTFN